MLWKRARLLAVWIVATGLVVLPQFGRADSIYVSGPSFDIFKIAPDGTSTTLVTALPHPTGLALDTSGNLYAACMDDGIIRKITPGGAVSNFAGGFFDLQGLAFDSSGYLYAANMTSDTYGTGNITKIAPNGAVSTFASGLGQPWGLAFDTGGNLYDSENGDSTNSIINKITPGGVVSTFVSAGPLLDPGGLAFDSSGNLYAANYGGYISMITPSGAVSTVASMAWPQGVAFDSGGTLYATQGYYLNTLDKIAPNGTASPFAYGAAGDIAVQQTSAAVPVPAAAWMGGVGLMGMAVVGWLRRRRLSA
jgi:hypothetical protein